MGVKLKEKNPGEWWIFINHQGRRKSKKIGRDKRLALEVAKKIEAKLALGEMNLEDKKERIPTFGEYASRWIATTVPATCKPSTLKDYTCILGKHVLPVFGKKPVDEINRLMVKEFLMEKSNAGFSGSTLTHIKNVISGTLNLAVDDEVIPLNPAQRLGKAIKVKPRRLAIEPLTREELSLLLETFKAHFPRHYPMALTLARTGMRLGEVLALQWGDIDFNGRFINLQRGFSRGRIETPKSGEGRRVDMSKQLTETLFDLNRQRKEGKLRKGWKELPEWVFISDVGKPLIANHWRKLVFDKALVKVGLRRVRIHDLRHAYASLLTLQRYLNI